MQDREARVRRVCISRGSRTKMLRGGGDKSMKAVLLLITLSMLAIASGAVLSSSYGHERFVRNCYINSIVPATPKKLAVEKLRFK